MDYHTEKNIKSQLYKERVEYLKNKMPLPTTEASVCHEDNTGKHIEIDAIAKSLDYIYSCLDFFIDYYPNNTKDDIEYLRAYHKLIEETVYEQAKFILNTIEYILEQKGDKCACH